ncbi:MAG: histidine phosphatase family protein [Actinomycetota bacterium]|nr:histidine phosphatase family protein [Actinomycetota bacterium]
MARILLVRHAQSEWNALGRWQGWADPPLSPLGRHQAEQAGRHLSAHRYATVTPRAGGESVWAHRDDPSADGEDVPAPVHVVSSDLLRASMTAGIVTAMALPGVLPETDPDWREYRVGAWSGLTRPEIEDRWPGELDRWDRGELAAPPEGEHRNHFESRLVRALDRVATHAGDAGTSLVVTHGGAIRSLSRRFRAPVDHVGNLAGMLVEGSAGRFRQVGPLDLLNGREGAPAIPD